MREKVFQIHTYCVGHRIDKQLLLSLEDIFMQYNENSVLEICIECSNNTGYNFDSIDECFDYFSKKPYRIIKMEIVVTFEKKYDSNRITMIFDNGEHASTEIRFQFNNNDDYLLLKNKIELCLNNFRLNYRIFSIIPIMPTILTSIFILICVYTGSKNIIFPKQVQYSITSIWIGGSFVFASFSPFRKMKREIFPCTEFRIGQNELIEERNATERNFIVGSVIIGTILGVIGNYISDILF